MVVSLVFREIWAVLIMVYMMTWKMENGKCARAWRVEACLARRQRCSCNGLAQSNVLHQVSRDCQGILHMQSTTRRRRIVAGIIGTLVLVYFGLAPTSTDIRLDTGDLRYRYFGIPLIYDRMPEPQRSRLLELTRGSKVCTSEWKRCAKFPLHGSNNPDAMCRGFYMRIEAWVDVDKKLALAGVEDVARYVRETNATEGLPKSAPLLSETEWSDQRPNAMRVKKDWTGRRT
jgi:hypothetical protein